MRHMVQSSRRVQLCMPMLPSHADCTRALTLLDNSYYHSAGQGRRTRLGMMMVSSPSVSLACMPLSWASLLRGILMSTALRGLARSAACKQPHALCQVSEAISTR